MVAFALYSGGESGGCRPVSLGHGQRLGVACFCPRQGQGDIPHLRRDGQIGIKLHIDNGGAAGGGGGCAGHGGFCPVGIGCHICARGNRQGKLGGRIAGAFPQAGSPFAAAGGDRGGVRDRDLV